MEGINFPFAHVLSPPKGKTVEDQLKNVRGIVSARLNIALDQIKIEFILTMISAHDLKKQQKSLDDSSLKSSLSK